MRAPSSVVLSIGSLSAATGSHFWCHKSEDGLCMPSVNDDFSHTDMREFVRSVNSASRPVAHTTVDASTIQNKVLAGYQGWAGAKSTWEHWTTDRKIPSPSAKNEHFEMIPQMGEYPVDALHATEFKYNGNGSVIKLYENAVDGVVDLHVKWMRDYGMDGVLLQRFISHCTEPGTPLTQRNTILEHMDAAATKYGRVYAMMWDISGDSSDWDKHIEHDFTDYVQKYTTRQQYLKENGKPIVCIYGIGMVTRNISNPSQSLNLVRWLQGKGLYVIGSGPYYWRAGGHDAANGFDEVHAAFDAIMPWAVGRYRTVSDFNQIVPNIEADAKLTSGRNQGYAPVAYPGYSYRKNDKFNEIKRNAGLFFKAQIDSHLNTQGITFYYIAMFDEVQEGTAIYKVAANEAESAKGRSFVTASTDGVDCPGDLYLTMAGHYTAAAHGGPQPSPTPSPSPTPIPGPTPVPPSAQDTLAAGNRLSSGSKLVSASGKARLEMQAADGNLVLRYEGATSSIWSSKTSGYPGAELHFQKSDGNLVLYADSKALWESGPASGAVKVKLQDDCNLVTRDARGASIWSLGTSCSDIMFV